ncbi:MULTISPECIES: DICT sensory domain-containing protein [unclassified Leptolyngbya]|uniref:DICT sensory domain-containing protein n=1 Tax=unclassified Leptolyngbya TaxID=2650499 RepID=UPI0016859678|nr:MULTISPECIES: DICT sensory domain-containing protein [unclassified Leptolyngbya]MBD1910175.1 GAF domain-containing protein [Leptolyngbya sp. FACHB-8]MBD2154075.1 GAF domain-containing protein [Leptolyngbya sp. FACHB-16]
MSISSSVLDELLQRSPHLRPQLYFKSSLTALSHAMEDQVLAAAGHPLVIANFQQERFYRQEAHRYRRIATLSSQVYVLAAPETSFTDGPQDYELIAFEPDDQLTQEWHLVVIGSNYAACLICRERFYAPDGPEAMDQNRRFEGVWTFDRQISCQAAEILLERIQAYRPDLKAKIADAKDQLRETAPPAAEVAADPFVQRLITHLQAGQYKLLKAYRSMASQERRERLVNSIVMAIRESLDPAEIFRVGVQQLQQAMGVCRCIVYRCKASDATAQILYEARREETIPSLLGQTWPLQTNPLFQQVAQTRRTVAIANTIADPALELTPLQPTLEQWHIYSWLLVPVVYQGRLLGVVELHHCMPQPHAWSEEEQSLVEAIANQLGVALIQAESYANLGDLNEQLEALDRTRSNLIAITGHELRTPLSTIQICLESLASEPDMPLELRQVMLNTALTDAERMRKLVQDFLTLSRLESGRVEWHLEPLAIGECVSLALSSIKTRQNELQLPEINAQVSEELPLVRADGERLVEVLSKLLDNACKFTEPEGEVVIEAHPNGDRMLEVTITDTGRGIEPTQLEAVFDRFYQEEGALRRTASGTGLGLAICRQIILAMGGRIWAESDGRDRGSRFHFTVPIAKENGRSSARPSETVPTAPSRKRRSAKDAPKAK